MHNRFAAWIDARQLTPGSRFAGTVPIAALSGLSDMLLDGEGDLNATLEIVRAASGRPALRAHVDGQVSLQCQRCLGPMDHEISQDLEVELVGSEADAERLSDTADTWVIEDGRLQVRALLAEEVALGLPMMPTHAKGDCQPPGEAVVD